MASKQTAKLTVTKQCKNSVRFDDQSEEPTVVSSVYLLRDAYDALGKPKEIEIVVKTSKE
jgi:hypothetical protein